MRRLLTWSALLSDTPSLPHHRPLEELFTLLLAERLRLLEAIEVLYRRGSSSASLDLKLSINTTAQMKLTFLHGRRTSDRDLSS